MHTNNIELLRDEAQRLLRLQMEVLGQMMAAPNVITPKEEGLQQTFDRTSTPQYIEVLQGELTKLENMELVIAVVGTMKAGKSTTINAIVGTEVLPNRNRPMTALPTLIRHTPGQIEPILKFENNEPINRLFETIRERIATGKVDNELKDLATDSDMQELIGNITSQKNFGQHYEGAANIFWCLKTLNDLVRLSSGLGVAFPFSSYSNVAQMPVITVEFAHLREAGKAHGQLTLLDTPGPNEAGQDHLRDMLKEQLKKASAILAVFDYTQLKSDADEQVRAEIEGIAAQHKGRLFALVNKFDNKDENSDGEKETKVQIKKLMQGKIETKDVFPVSSKLGCLANRAKHEIAINGKLPDPEKEPWVSYFAVKAFGELWDADDINDHDSVMRSAEKLWKKSGFHDPMENVIRAAHTNAALLSVDSAAEKLVKCATDIENFLGIRTGAFKHDVEKLQKDINNLKETLKTVGRLEANTKEKIESTLKNLEEETKKTVKDANTNSKGEVDKYFKEGKIAEKEAIAVAVAEQERAKHKGIIDRFKGHSENKQHFNPDTTTLKFKDEDDAKKLIKIMQEAVEKSIDGGKNELSKSIESMLENFRTDFGKDAEAAKVIISSINSTMNNDGFKVSLIELDVKNLNKNLKNNEFSLREKIGNKTRSETYRVKQDGWWGGCKRFFSDDWGYDERTRTVDEYIIVIKDIKEFVIGVIDSDFASYTKAMNEEVIKPLSSDVDEFFNQLKRTIENVSGDLQQSIHQKENTQGAELDALKECLERFAHEIPGMKKDSKALAKDVNNLKFAPVAA